MTDTRAAAARIEALTDAGVPARRAGSVRAEVLIVGATMSVGVASIFAEVIAAATAGAPVTGIAWGQRI